MNYIKEINSFREYNTHEQIHGMSQALWYLLMHINNKCGWKSWFNCTNTYLMNELGLSKNTLIKHRTDLQKRGIILYESRARKKQSGLYHLNSMEKMLINIGVVSQTGSKYEPESEDVGQTGSKYEPELEDVSQTGSKYEPESEEISQTGSKYEPESEEISQTGSKYEPELEDVNQTGSKYEPELEDVNQTGSKYEPELEDVNQTGSKYEPELENVGQTGSKYEPELENVGQTGSKYEPELKTGSRDEHIPKHSSNSSSNITTTTTRNSEFKKIIKFYQENIRPITPFEGEKLNSWFDIFSSDVIIVALEKCVLSDKRTFNYLEGILRNWETNDLKTVEAIEANERKFKSGISSSQTGSQKKKNSFHNFDERPKYSNEELEKKLGIR